MTFASFGELLIDFVAQETGVDVGDASGFIKAPGGAPANVAVALARLGENSAFLGQVGDDPFGRHLASVLQAQGVNVTGLRFSDEARTALAFVSLRADGDRSFMFYRHPSADMLMRPEDIDLEIVRTARVFHYGSITLIGEPSRSATLTAVEAARAAGAFISYDPNLRLALWPSAEAARTGMLAGLELAHFVKISDEELEFLTGGNSVEPLWRYDLQMIAITHGAHGSTLHTRTERFHHPGYRVEAVDTTGAGDAFVAGFLAALEQQRRANAGSIADPAAILAYANAVGAITTTRKGAIPALPDTAAVNTFLAAQL